MGVFDKIKNALFEEEYVEVEEKPKAKPKKEKAKREVKKESKEVVKVKENKPIAKKVILPEKKEERVPEIEEEELLEEDFEITPSKKDDTAEFRFPAVADADFDVEEDFSHPEPQIVKVIERESPRVEQKEVPQPTLYGGKNNSKKESNYYGFREEEVAPVHEYGAYEKKEDKTYFKPSPIISPIYGILDKNYKKDEVSKSKNSLEQTKELVINFDTIRQKAYGSLSEDIERELSTKEDKIDEIEKEIDNILEENNLLTDLEEDIPESIEVKKIEVEPEEEYNYSDFGVEYKISEEPKPDPKPKKTKVKDSVSLDDSLDKDDKKEQEENKDKQVELTEDLFNLIDSMYDR